MSRRSELHIIKGRFEVFSFCLRSQAGSESNGQQKEDDTQRPTKKQKIEPKTHPPPNIIKLIFDPDTTSGVLVSEDKCLRVFQIREDGQVEITSERIMPKRPCAVQIVSQSNIILCGDKFGDVYSLPLYPDSSFQPSNEKTEETVPESKPFVPAANVLTVHSKRNRRALDAQLKQSANPVKPKEGLNFEHELLLGHVSMLTDLAYVNREVEGKKRSYLLTADRDEHIRISRGPPQAHVIHGYCLGHTEFVSQICPVPGHDLLISGGGDPWVGVWNLSTFQLRQRFDVRSLMLGDARTQSGLDSQDTMTTVSGIWIASLHVGERVEATAIIACEKFSTLVFLPISLLAQPTEQVQLSIAKLQHPVLGITTIGGSIIVSLDARGDGQDRIQAYRLEAEGEDLGKIVMKESEETQKPLSKLNAVTGPAQHDKQFDDLLYGLSNLRKWAGGTDADDGVEEAGD